MVKFLVKFILNIFDNISKKKILLVLNNIFKDKINFIIDVGSHHGETIIFLNNNFKYNKIFAFEPSSYNYQVLKKKINFINNNNIFLINKGIGIKSEKKILTQYTDSSSCTYCPIKTDSKYFLNKKKIFNFNANKENRTEETQTISLKVFMMDNKLPYINYLKTDTEGFELNVLKSLENFINRIKLIHFEHHYDDMYVKNYKFSDIHKYLLNNNFIQVYKFKMHFRKSFEYFYLNNSILVND
jgi:FkbM family methyltransferase